MHPTSATIDGADILATDTIYSLNVEPTSGINQDYSIEWTLENNENEHVGVKSVIGTNCTLTLKSSIPVGKVILKATITCTNGKTIIATKEINLNVKLNINITSNQGLDNVIKNNAQANIQFGNETIIAKTGDIVSVPINKNIIVSFNEVDGYKTPDTQIFTTGNGDINIEAQYKTEVVNVNLTIETGVSLPSSVIVFVNNKKYVWENFPIIAKIPFDVTYDIEFENIEGFTAPTKQTFTADSVSRNVIGAYEGPPNEVVLVVNPTSSSTFSILGRDFDFSQISEIYINGVKQNTIKYGYSFTPNVDNIVRIKMNKSNFTNCYKMFYIDYSSSYDFIKSIDLSKLDTSKVTNMEYMFNGRKKVTSLDLSNLDTSNVTSMQYMFYYCVGLQSLNLSGLDTRNVTNMCYMFCSCNNLSELDVSSFNTSNVTNMNSMFSDC